MAPNKCVHRGCGKEYSDPEEVCRYHPGPPVFHEGQKGTRALFYTPAVAGAMPQPADEYPPRDCLPVTAKLTTTSPPQDGSVASRASSPSRSS